MDFRPPPSTLAVQTNSCCQLWGSAIGLVGKETALHPHPHTRTHTHSHRHPSLGFGTPNQSHSYSCRHFYTHIHTCCAGLPVEEGKVCLSSKYVTVQCSRTVTVMEIRKHRKVGYRKGPGQHRTPKPSYSVSDLLQL